MCIYGRRLLQRNQKHRLEDWMARFQDRMDVVARLDTKNHRVWKSVLFRGLLLQHTYKLETNRRNPTYTPSCRTHVKTSTHKNSKYKQFPRHKY